MVLSSRPLSAINADPRCELLGHLDQEEHQADRPGSKHGSGDDSRRSDVLRAALHASRASDQFAGVGGQDECEQCGDDRDRDADDGHDQRRDRERLGRVRVSLAARDPSACGPGRFGLRASGNFTRRARSIGWLRSRHRPECICASRRPDVAVREVQPPPGQSRVRRQTAHDAARVRVGARPRGRILRRLRSSRDGRRDRGSRRTGDRR